MNQPNDAVDLIRTTFLDPCGVGSARRYFALRGRLGVDAFLPVDARRAAANSLQRRTDETRWIGLFGRRCLAAGVRCGIVPRASRTRFELPAPDADNLAGAVAAALGRDDIVIAGVLGPVRPNLKPVLQVFDESGATLAFVKIGWNDLTRRLVTHEHDVLVSLRPDSTMSVPQAIARCEVGAAVGLVLSPLPLWHFGRRPHDAPAGSVIAAIATLRGPMVERGLSDSTFVQSLATVADESTTGAATLRRALDRVLADIGSTTLRFGASHGDFSPWNTLRTGGHIAIWDWERFRADVPVGLDLIHYITQQQARRPLESLPAVATGDFGAAQSALAELGVARNMVDAFVTLYYADLLTRYERDAQGGDAPGLRAMRDVAERALRARLDRTST